MSSTSLISSSSAIEAPLEDASPSPASGASRAATRSGPAWWRLERWRYAVASFSLGVAYSGVSLLLGFEYRLGEQDVSLLVGVLLEVSFGAFGYLWGLNVEARRREKEIAREMERRLRESAQLRLRLAHTEKLASVGQLASTVAHEFRNPLAILRSMAQNLIEELPEGAEESERFSREMIEEIDRLARVTSKLVDYARPLVIEPRPCQVREVAEKVRFLGSEMLRGKRLRLALHGHADLWLDADPDLLSQVLLGLLENAVHASPEEEAIEISWSRADASVRIEIADRGDGVPESERESIFEPFYTTRPDGHGLGLAVARQIIEAHGGRLEAIERLGGATFQILLPAREPAGS